MHPCRGVAISLAANFDWEDLTIADGKIFISDMGNNGNARRDLGIYIVNEPNPHAIEKTRILKHLPVRYADQETFPGPQVPYSARLRNIEMAELMTVPSARW